MSVRKFLAKPYVIIKTQFEGFHYWKDAPHEVAFLRDKHRHIFYVIVKIEVSDCDRDIEIIMCKRAIDQHIKKIKTFAENNGWSCEEIAKSIGSFLWKTYNHAVLTVEVLEDNENGGGIMYEQM